MTTVTRPDGSTVVVDGMSSAVVIYAVDAAGVYLGLLEPTEGRVQADGPPPGANYRWVNGRWRLHRTLDDLKAEKNAAINAWRLAANRAAFTYGGKAIACDELSRSDIEGVNGVVATTGSLPSGFPGAWKARDNTFVSLPDVAAWQAFYAAMVAQGTANFVQAQQLKAQLAAASTAEQVAAITLPEVTE